MPTSGSVPPKSVQLIKVSSTSDSKRKNYFNLNSLFLIWTRTFCCSQRARQMCWSKQFICKEIYLNCPLDKLSLTISYCILHAKNYIAFFHFRLNMLQKKLEK
jgi:hypothetical protein